MHCEIQGISYEYCREIRDNEPLRRSFNSLAQAVFGLSFENWHRGGWWNHQYVPHVLFQDGRAVSNVSVNLIDFLWQGKPRRYLQLGTVMTHPEYRGRGLNRWLLERVLECYAHTCDAVFLFANHSVLDFYPKFGFEPAPEWQCRFPIAPRKAEVLPLDMENPADVRLLLEKYRESNPYSRFPFLGNPGLLMFYCSQFLKDCVLYLPDDDAIVIAEFDGHEMLCYDIYGKAGAPMMQLLAGAAKWNTRTVELGFSPVSDLPAVPIADKDDTLFLLNGSENLFREHALRFPLLSKA